MCQATSSATYVERRSEGRGEKVQPELHCEAKVRLGAHANSDRCDPAWSSHDGGRSLRAGRRQDSSLHACQRGRCALLRTRDGPTERVPRRSLPQRFGRPEAQDIRLL